MIYDPEYPLKLKGLFESTAGRQPSAVSPLRELSQMKRTQDLGPRSYSFPGQLASNDWGYKGPTPLT